MEALSEPTQIIVAPQVFVSTVPDEKEMDAPEKGPRRADIAVAWSWDEASFRMDVSVPQAGALEIIFPLKAEIVYVNGEIVWDHKGLHKIGAGTISVQPAGAGLRLTFAAGGPYHILAGGMPRAASK